MALINKNTFDILQSIDFNGFETFDCGKGFNKEDYFECDEEIAPVISLLNKKGYKTKFCCQGHLYDSIGCGAFSLNMYEGYDIYENVPGIIQIENEDRKMPSVIFRQQVSSDMYIIFEDASNLPEPPKGFYLKNNKLETDIFPKSISCTDKYMQDKPYSFFTKKIKLLSLLYKWVEELPDADNIEPSELLKE
ncbi:hypothetical protein [Butyrivibrio proteoclasticus]|uniref:hypothetical protein n=1 Tax=Butyrivibrio proteoclasticus TaxID=43305 RepID=UPI00047D57F7|nr:hypothetical protein [Butyrivibrio proteoclasticus]